MAEIPLRFYGEVSVFTGELTLPAPGAYLLQVLASQPDTENFGRAEAWLVVEE